MTTQWLLLLLVVFLLAASAFFVAAEFSLIAARRTVVEPMAVTSSRARSALRAMEQVSLMMACAQLGITLCGVLLGALGEPAVAALLEPVFHGLGVPEAWLHPVSLVLALFLVVSAHVALGEMVPKNIAIAGPEKTAIALAPAMLAISTAIGPIIRALNAFANAMVRLTGREPRDEVASAFTREEVADLVRESSAEGLLDPEDRELITSALDFDVSVVESVMVPDADVVSVPAGATAADIERACARTGFSRFPVQQPDGSFSGYLHIRDVVDIPAARRDEPVPTDRIRALPAVAPDTDLRTALDRMRRLGAHMAEVALQVPAGSGAPGTPVARLTAGGRPERVEGDGQADRDVDPGGGIGLLMLEDVLETLVGEIRDATRRRPDRGRVAETG
ncbi:HlyC/CorC family transporter [Nakamurella flava]|uniref:HlyC/CorC family transporter n=1 Tax=Nakamurella flava TaxID=2576308 RepID=A0A4U6QJL0_9ACTN|nr:hemolysin family protein [Nakamurella flava]TKV60667.1 HlyC/CorC family transporter [Nakamurella flava]